MSPLAEGLARGEDKVVRCWWCGSLPDYVAYHDREWGVPMRDDTRLFEKLSLEGFQSGLSWLTILRKRENFRAAFAGFDVERIARFGARDVTRLLGDAGIVRHRGKIEAVINNAQRCLELREEAGSLAAFIWGFEPASRPAPRTRQDIVSQSPESVALSKALKKRGWKFVGPTTMYAFFQAMGLVNDHLVGCSRRAELLGARERCKVPKGQLPNR